MAAETGLQCEKVVVSRSRNGTDERTILNAISAAFSPGEMTLVVGETGSGKTTFLHVLACLIRPDEGEVLAQGKPVSRWVGSHRDQWRKDIGIAFQSPMLLPELTALENVMVPLIPREIKLEELRILSLNALKITETDHLAGQSTRDLSGGEKQRIALARALVTSPKILLLDEPTAHQDDKGFQCISRILLVEKKGGAIIIVASHDTRLQNSEIADHVLHLHDGSLTEVG